MSPGEEPGIKPVERATSSARHTTRSPLRRAGIAAATLVAATLLFAALAAPSAIADFGIASFEGRVTANEAGDPQTHAGAHPFDATTTMMFNTTTNDAGQTVPDGQVKDIVVDLPPGFIGDPTATPKCSMQDFEAGASAGECPDDTQVGFGRVFRGGAIPQTIWIRVYNLTPLPGEPARFGARLQGFGPSAAALIVASVRTGAGYGLTVTSPNVSNAIPVLGVSLTLWGIPADSAHDGLRGSCVRPFSGPSGDTCPVQTERQPFLTNPTDCSAGPLTTTMRADSWEDPGDFKSASFDHDPDGVPMAVEDCENLSFEPSLSLRPAKTAADSPSGYEVELSVPQNDDPDALATPPLKQAVVTLPEGLSVNPAAADGLGACSPQQIGLDSDEDASCPEPSKVGTVRIDTPLLPEPMTGGVYVAEQEDNPFESLLAIYLVARGSGVIVKLAGRIDPDPSTGRLTATFDGNPQLPFERLELSLFGGPRAPLANPPTCGRKTTTAELTPWSAPDSGPAAEPSDSFDITSGPKGQPCSSTLAQRPFSPDFAAGLQNPLAGSSSPFLVKLKRSDGEQELHRIDVELPQGVSAVLADVPACGNSQANAGTCGEGSRVGTAMVSAGAGTNPYWIRDGRVYLTGPYKGAPVGLSIVVPAVAGPFDLGEVVVRAAVHVDPRDAHITVRSDPIPKILEGIPLRVREVRIAIDRPGFMVSPTSCDPMAVGARATGSHGRSANLSDRFQLAECGRLGFDPKLAFKISGKKATKRSQHPALDARLSTNEGDANIDRVEVTLPKGTFLDQANIANICTRPQYGAGECPENSIFGRATATTPLLAEPLSGNVYLRASDNPLPDLVADLNGQVKVDLVGEIDSPNNRIRNDFAIVPDVPVSDFQLRIDGGPEGLLVNSRDICKRKKLRKTKAQIFAHNGKTAHDKPKVKAKCKRKGKGKGKGKKKGKRGKRRGERKARRAQ